jgi:hypothetical protein
MMIAPKLGSSYSRYYSRAGTPIASEQFTGSHESKLQPSIAFTPMSTAKKFVAKPCTFCGRPIAPARLKALPGVTICVECARKNPIKIDPRSVDLSQASPICRNGFAPKD